MIAEDASMKHNKILVILMAIALLIGTFISAAAAGGIISYMTGVIPLRKEGCSDEPLFREYENSEIRHPSLA